MLFDLKMPELARLCKAQAEVVKKSKISEDAELAFLENTGEEKENIEVLKFEILKEIYIDKRNKKEQDASDVIKKQEIEKLDEIIAKKQNAELENMSVEELLKKREELMKK